MALKYQRILLKISGEALGGEKGMGFDEPTMDAICGGVKKAHDLGVQIGIVVGGGNFWRGRSSGKMERTLADKIGMLATVMNALAVSDKLEQLGVPTEVFTSITMPQVAQPFTRKDALRAMDEGKIAVFGGGTGNPFFSTDTATALRAVEVSADVMFKATMVDGVYDKDPHKYPDAKKYDTLTFTKVLARGLDVIPMSGLVAATGMFPPLCDVPVEYLSRRAATRYATAANPEKTNACREGASREGRVEKDLTGVSA